MAGLEKASAQLRCAIPGATTPQLSGPITPKQALHTGLSVCVFKVFFSEPKLPPNCGNILYQSFHFGNVAAGA